MKVPEHILTHEQSQTQMNIHVSQKLRSTKYPESIEFATMFHPLIFDKHSVVQFVRSSVEKKHGYM